VEGDEGSHLFQRVASFLQDAGLECKQRKFYGVLISFREWLHSYLQSARNTDGLVTIVLISFREWLHSYKDLLKLLREELENVLISFREWLHSYPVIIVNAANVGYVGSHLFQRVASFLLGFRVDTGYSPVIMFSSLSESGFIPTTKQRDS